MVLFRHFFRILLILFLSSASLGEHRIREINDEINKMMRQKHYWEIRVRELGGDSGKNRQTVDIEGKELPGAPGYRYYGAAKDLPGVRELFAERDDEVESRKQKRFFFKLFVVFSSDKLLFQSITGRYLSTHYARLLRLS
jgi:hypothetical protein